MHRFFVEPGQLGPQRRVTLTAIAHQVHAVGGLRAGDRITLLEGDGLEYPAEIVALTPRHLELAVGEPVPCATEPRRRLTLYQCALKGEKMEWVLQKATELGVARVVPVCSSRTIVRPVAAIDRKSERWRAILREAAEQSGRARMPELAPALLLADALQSASGLRLFPWESAPATGSGALEGTEVSLLVGPEGGFSADEAALAVAEGWRVISLGPRILRAETAALASLPALMAASGDMRSIGWNPAALPT